MENNIEAIVVSWAYIGMMENKMETTTIDYIGVISLTWEIGAAC